MKLVFLGAAHEVTGSCTYIEACGKKFLVDFGMEQGINYFENEKVPCPPSSIDFVLLTHAHIDHSGLLPLLYAGGFSGQIHSTKATANLCSIMLRDSAHIQEFEAEWRSRKGRRKGGGDVEPLYTMADAEGAIACFVPHDYDEQIDICPGIKVRYTDAGHLLGSSSIELWLTEEDQTRKLLFSGDIGNHKQPLIRDPQYVDTADYVIMEATYGNRRHDPPKDYVQAFAQIIQTTFDRGGNVVIPSFAVGRTQELLYFLRQIKAQGLVRNHAGFPVYVDSPLAIEATRIFIENKDSCFDEEAMSFVNRGINPITFDDLNLATTSDESRAINFDNTPKIIISAMGRSLVEGAKTVKLFGEEISVKAQILVLAGISGHADVDGLNGWISSVKGVKKVFVNHSEASVADEFTAHLKKDFGLEAYAPYSGGVLNILTGEFTNAAPIPVEKKSKGFSPGYQRLVASLERLTALVNRSSGLTNKELAKMTDTLNNLCSKWED